MYHSWVRRSMTAGPDREGGGTPFLGPAEPGCDQREEGGLHHTLASVRGHGVHAHDPGAAPVGR